MYVVPSTVVVNAGVSSGNVDEAAYRAVPSSVGRVRPAAVSVCTSATSTCHGTSFSAATSLIAASI